MPQQSSHVLDRTSDPAEYLCAFDFGIWWNIHGNVNNSFIQSTSKSSSTVCSWVLELKWTPNVFSNKCTLPHQSLYTPIPICKDDDNNDINNYKQ
uniref:Uncharacterized protein n=1 Tax=Anguilla anguilla TaxID=7936 RepID=A0A0E9PJN3_ANGAN